MLNRFDVFMGMMSPNTIHTILHFAILFYSEKPMLQKPEGKRVRHLGAKTFCYLFICSIWKTLAPQQP